MKSLIVNTNPQNNWLSSNITAYLKSGEYNYNTGPIEAQNLPQDVISNFGQVVQYFLGLGAGEWSVTQVIAEQGFQYSSGHYETEVVTGENNLYDELGNLTGSEQVLYNKENYIEDYSKPTINLSVTDSLTANSSMQRTTYHNSQNFPQNVESGALFVWDFFKNNY
jgi:hypothetical protein